MKPAAIKLTTAALSFLAVSIPARAQVIDKIYWTARNSGTILRSNLDGNSVETMVSGLSSPRGLVLDVDGQKMYWTDQGTQKLQRASLIDGSNIQDLVTTGLSTPRMPAIDTANGKIYWPDGGNATMKRANLDGSTVEQLPIPNLSGPFGLDFDLAAGKMYWTDYGVSKIRRADLPMGANDQDLITSGLSTPLGLALDTTNGWIYWTDNGTQNIRRVHFDGNGTEVLISGLGSPVNVALDVSRGRMYWTEESSNVIKGATLTGGSAVVLVSGQSGASGIDLVLAAPFQACCLNGGCQNIKPADCTTAGGTPQGVATTCASLADSDSDGSPNVCDNCPADPAKTQPGACGCGHPDLDCNTNGRVDCLDIAGNTSVDCNSSGVPDECEAGRWIGADGGSFSTAANWTPASVPNASAILANANAANNRSVLSQAGTTNVCAVSISATGAGKQTLQIASASRLNVSGGTTIAAGGEVSFLGGELAGGTVTNATNSITGYGTVSASVTNDGLIESAYGGILNLTGASFQNRATGVLSAPFRAGIHIQSPSVVQSGEIEIRPGGDMLFDSALTNSAGAHLRLLGGIVGADSLTNAAGGQIYGFGMIDSDITNNGDVVLIADTEVIGNLQNNGTITIQSGILTVTGSLSGSGTIIGGFGGREAGPENGSAGRESRPESAHHAPRIEKPLARPER